MFIKVVFAFLLTLGVVLVAGGEGGVGITAVRSRGDQGGEGRRGRRHRVLNCLCKYIQPFMYH